VVWHVGPGAAEPVRSPWAIALALTFAVGSGLGTIGWAGPQHAGIAPRPVIIPDRGGAFARGEKLEVRSEKSSAGEPSI
jgi:hypothetical protein